METTNYDLFSFKNENRGISRIKVKQLTENFKNYGYDPNYPILIDNNFKIIDGQHRFIACKESNLPIIYNLSRHITNEYMRSLNITSSAWELSDYIKSYASEGIECYVKFLQFKESFNITFSNSIVIMFGTGGNVTKKIRNGENIKIFENYKDVAIYLNRFELSFNKRKSFVEAIKKLFDAKIDEKYKNIILDKQLLIQEMASTNQYLKCFENIINNRKGNKGDKIVLV